MLKHYLLLSSFLYYFLIAGTQPFSQFIIVDQFGYPPDAKKIAVIKNPQNGFDSHASFKPGDQYAVVNAGSGEQVFTESLVAWKNGQVDETSGDIVWHFDFTSVTENGTYYILDIMRNVRSYDFNISPSVYNEVLKQAVRTFFYQRVGFAKEEPYADAAWVDGASHVGPLQDKNCRLFSDKDNTATEKDVSGGWYDAGDYNKYTSWTANYVVEMMKMYIERPQAWSDDYNIPESGNGIPDLLDEAKWGVDHLLRLQFDDGSVISIVDESHASPPSNATGQSLYGPPNTSATLNTAGAFALSSVVYRSIGMDDYADTLVHRAKLAWNWATVNPDSLFNNNDAAYNSQGIGAGQMEIDNYGRDMARLEAACFLFDATGNVDYREFVDDNYKKSHFVQWNFAYPFETENQEILLYYANLENATPTVADDIKTRYKNAMKSGSENFPAVYSNKDPYLAHLKDYTWGSNSIKSAQGNMFMDIIHYDVDSSLNEDAKEAAIAYINYIHGVNPLNMTYLSNMYKYGGDNCVNEFYHTWFTNNSAKWDRVGTSEFGPPPGYVTGGPNPSYDWDNCCPTNCGSSSNNAACYSESISPPKNQPKQKSYKEFNTGWPLNSWQITENSCSYQVNYMRLLSKFVDTAYDCHGDLNGTAYLDKCGTCVGGNTEKEPTENPDDCPTLQLNEFSYPSTCSIYESPSGRYIWDTSGTYTDTLVTKAGWLKVITTDLTVNQPTESSIDVMACELYSSPSGDYIWNQSGNFIDTILNMHGCDSIISIHLVINKNSDTSLYAEACEQYTTFDGQHTWTQSGVYTQTKQNSSGCDSIITYNVVIENEINTNVEMTGQNLIASADNVTYQWLDCNNNYASIQGALSQTYSPAASGKYAVLLQGNLCSDTSACYTVEVTGMFYNSFEKTPSVYPNPAFNVIHLELPEPNEYMHITITNIAGEVIKKYKLHDTKSCTIDMDIPKGCYVLTIRNEKQQQAIMKIMKQ